jgi:hypothetical protein
MSTSNLSSVQGIVSNMTGATSTLPGTAGSAPAPAAGEQTGFLRGDATFASASTVTSGAPEGVVTGNVGDLYVNSATDQLYYKKTGTNTTSGWQLVA